MYWKTQIYSFRSQTNQWSNTISVVNIEFPSQLLNLLIPGICISLGGYHIRWQSGFIKNIYFPELWQYPKKLATIEVAYLALSTETECSLIWDIMIDMNQCAYPKKFTWNLFTIVSTDHFPIASEVYQYTHSSK